MGISFLTEYTHMQSRTSDVRNVTVFHLESKWVVKDIGSQTCPCGHFY
jgi:hypothetical protein